MNITDLEHFFQYMNMSFRNLNRQIWNALEDALFDTQYHFDSEEPLLNENASNLRHKKKKIKEIQTHFKSWLYTSSGYKNIFVINGRILNHFQALLYFLFISFIQIIKH